MAKAKDSAIKAIPYIGVLSIVLISLPKMMGISEGVIDLLARLILLLITIGVFSYFIMKYFHHELQSGRYHIMYWVFILIGFGPSVYLADVNPYVLPILLGSALITSMIHVRLGFITNFVMLTVLLTVSALPFEVYIIYLLAGAFISIIIPYGYNRRQIVYVGIAISVLMIVLTALTVSLIDADVVEFGIVDLLIAGLNGTLVVIITIGSEPIWELVFRITSDARLIELSSLNEPILKRLLREAPGTYHHCLTVADLAEKAAIDIGANHYLARAGAMYHDIGKLRRPEYFTENQKNKNIHDELSPDASAAYIISHVSDGVKLAKEHKLPKILTDIILQHQGDAKITYFYERALEHSDGFDIDVKLFKYPGPKPQTKEAAIIMLADCVEAASKALTPEEKDMAHIKEIIASVMLTVFKNNQLNESPLKFSEMNTIAKAFMRVYNGMFHERVRVNRESQK